MVMHPKIDFPGTLQPIIEDLHQPLHAASLREIDRKPKGNEADLGGGYRLVMNAFASDANHAVLADDLHAFMQTVMQVPQAEGGYEIVCERGDVAGADGYEAHRITTEPRRCVITAGDLDGLRRGVYRVQSEIRQRRAPLLPLGDVTRSTTLRTRMIRCPIAPYRWLSGWELEDDFDFYPEEYLRRIAHAGINGLWVPGLLRKLVASATLPELGPPEHRLDRLRDLIAKAGRHGIRVYLFVIEPRALPEDHPAALAHPELLGPRGMLCPSTEPIIEYIKEVMHHLFTEAPGLAGVINIFCGERATTCGGSLEFQSQCPRCRDRDHADVHADTLAAFMEGIRAASETAEFMAWTYMMDSLRETRPITPMLDVMRRTHPEVIWLGNFEHGSTKQLCGQEVEIHEYSLSCIGPSPYFRELASETRAADRTIYAKLQVGTSYELSSVPYIPAPGIVDQKIDVTRELGVTGSMMTWIPGGFPSPMLKAVGESAFNADTDPGQRVERVAADDWGEARAPIVARAWACFADAWQQYPFDNGTLYWGPITRGVAYQLHLEKEQRRAKPYNWGYNRKREAQPFEDGIELWLGPYTVDQVVTAFRGMAELWQQGLDLLDGPEVKPRDGEVALQRQVAVARAIRLQMLAAANVYAFYHQRDQLLDAEPARQQELVRSLIETAEHDRDVASGMLELMEIEPTLGYEPEVYDFSFSKTLVEEKILQVSDMLPMLRSWLGREVNREVLERTTEEAEWLRPDRIPDRWGD